ncbi:MULTISPECIES: type IV pilus modification protein PilV [unclassified Uliginosibacterium]|uniref:type IV pilus modification protein PilV n=1 Tax=unclassified Uliginosibacterium TaxID=2621521 RepID=UPI000C7D0F17|nr:MULTISPECIES: type IV pilus modification protein PilV [unclassified Uliginosibacterium]MDO6384682.1 type IV pilus modification protein PilV [Uliginosibacterium sp. 31-12]PLK48399.1 type IV pilus modification protein PilV [Uliginosibacterium sp. TH139]
MMTSKEYEMLARRSQAGVTLIEVLVSITVLVLGLVGLAALQAKTLMMSQSSYYRSIAADLATNLGERIRANRSPFLADSTSEVKPATPPDFSKCVQNTSDKSTVTCSAQDSTDQAYRVSTEMTDWNTLLRTQLPEATYTLTSAAGNYADHFRYTLTITWLDDRSQSSNTNTSYSVVIE